MYVCVCFLRWESAYAVVLRRVAKIGAYELLSESKLESNAILEAKVSAAAVPVIDVTCNDSGHSFLMYSAQLEYGYDCWCAIAYTNVQELINSGRCNLKNPKVFYFCNMKSK